MYIPGITELLIAKGAAWIFAHITHAGLIQLSHYVVAHGVVASLTTLAPIAITGSFIVGGVIWTAEKIKMVNDLLQDIKNENIVEAAKKIIKIAGILNSTYTGAADAITTMVTKYYGDNGNIQQICSTIQNIASKIKKD